MKIFFIFENLKKLLEISKQKLHNKFKLNFRKNTEYCSGNLENLEILLRKFRSKELRIN